MKQHELTLEQKISFISDKDGGNGFSLSKLAEKCEILKSSVANILIRGAKYQDDHSSNVNRDIKGKLTDESAKYVDEILFKWFTTQNLKYIPISGPMLQEKMREIDEEMDTTRRVQRCPVGGFTSFVIGIWSDSDKFRMRV